jgi:hypothetical protein
MTSPVVIDPTSTGLSEPERIGDTFVAPSKTFRDILRNAAWWGPLVLLFLFSIGSSLVVQKQVGFDRAYMNQLHATPAQEDRLNSGPPEQKAKAIAIGTTITKVIAFAGPVVVLIVLGIYSLILWAAFNFGLGASTTFPQVFAVSMYSALPYLLINILIMITVLFGGNAEAFNYQNPVGTNLAYYLPDTHGWLKGLLASLDVIKIWSDVLQAIGMAIIARKTLAQSAVIVGIFWLLGTLVTVAGAAFGG